jgi:hypothetical protein
MSSTCTRRRRRSAFDQPDSATIKIAIVVRKHVAFTAGRLPEAIAILGGTGLVAPTP